MSLNVEELINRFKERAEAVKNRSIPPVGGDDRMAFIKHCLLYTSPSPRDR